MRRRDDEDKTKIISAREDHVKSVMPSVGAPLDCLQVELCTYFLRCQLEGRKIEDEITHGHCIDDGEDEDGSEVNNDFIEGTRSATTVN